MKLPDIQLLRHIGMSDKAAKIYLAAIELGESSVQELAQTSALKRTSIYYVLNELLDSGALFQVQRETKTRYIAELPETLIRRAREQLSEDYGDGEVEGKTRHPHNPFNKPHIYFLHGPKGFKKIWDMIFASKTKEFCIITNGKSFLDFVKEKYVIDYIIKTKRKSGVRSKQLIVDSKYARDIVAKDAMENRQSKLLPSTLTLPFTEIISEKFVAFISPRFDNTLFVVENTTFAVTRMQIFEQLWENLVTPTAAPQTHS